MSRDLTTLADARTALTEAARYSGAGVRSTGRRVGRRARSVASESGTRAVLVIHALRGDLRRRPRRGELAMVCLLAGATGAVTALGVRQMVVVMRRNRADAVPEGATRIDDTAEPVTTGPARLGEPG